MAAGDVTGLPGSLWESEGPELEEENVPLGPQNPVPAQARPPRKR